jgi:hypothetical protein
MKMETAMAVSLKTRKRRKNMKKLLLFIFILLLTVLLVPGQTIVPLPDVVKAEALRLDNNRAYIVGGASIYIYNLEDLQLKKKFGKRGEGPQEFMVNPQTGRPMLLDVQTDDIIISSMGKVSYFTKDGVYKKEFKVGGSCEFFQPLGKYYAAVEKYVNSENGQTLKALRLYDRGFKPRKDLVTMVHHFQRGKGLEVFRECDFFITWGNKLYSVWDTDFKITVFDREGNKIKTIEHPYKRLKVTDQLKQQVIHYLKTHPTLKDIFHLLKPILFPTHLPAIRELRITDGKLYVFTFKEEKGRTQCLIFDLGGKLLDTRFIGLQKMDFLQTYPFGIKNGKLYQLIDNGEGWELHISTI